MMIERTITSKKLVVRAKNLAPMTHNMRRSKAKPTEMPHSSKYVIWECSAMVAFTGMEVLDASVAEESVAVVSENSYYY